jgi:putative glycosyltransferase (TIGR04372 family)
LLRFDTAKYATAIGGTAAYPAIQKQWGNRRPLLSLRDEDAIRGEECLRQLGIPRGAWFVCVHNREEGWSPADEHLHSYRNSKLASYVPAMRAIVERGGWCVRVGDPSMSKLPAMRNVVDYAHHPLRADWMDLVLCARCRFFLGNTSGPFLLSSVFGVAVALANLIPLSVVLPFGRQDLGIPKLLRQRGTARLLTFEEILSTAAGNYRFASQYREAGLEIRDNSPEEITELALEQLDCIEGRVVYTREDETLQSRFKALMKPGHYTYGSESRVGRDFLRRYAGLLPPTPG